MEEVVLRQQSCLPEIGDDREHGAGVEHDEEQRHLRSGGIEAHQLFGDDDVRGAGDRQQLGQSLDDGEDDDFEKGQADSLRAEGEDFIKTFKQQCSLRIAHLSRRLRDQRFASAFGERGDAVERWGGEDFRQAGGPAYFDLAQRR